MGHLFNGSESSCTIHETLHWRHNGHDSVSNHQPYCCLLNCLFRRRSKIISKLHVTGLCAGNSLETGEFPAQMARNAEIFPFDDLIMISDLVGASPNLWFEFNAPFNALPSPWKEKCHIPQANLVPQFWDKTITSCNNKMIREKIVSLKYLRPCSASFWEKKFETDFDRAI